MYRRHLKMVLLRDMESSKIRSEFLHRVASIPVVYLAWNIATDTYNSLKTSNKLINVSLTTTEKAAIFVSKPLLERLSKQLELADHLACRGLDSLQGIVPSIRHQQEKLYRHTKGIYDGTVESGLKKYSVAKGVGISKLSQFVNKGTRRFEELCASPYGEVFDVALDIAFGTGEIYVDYYLPPLGDERPEMVFGDRSNEPKWKRAKLLRNRIKERLYKHSLLKVQNIRLQTKSVIAKVYKFNLYEYIVEVSSAIPASATVLFVFSSIEDLISYLVSLFVGHIEENYNLV